MWRSGDSSIFSLEIILDLRNATQKLLSEILNELINFITKNTTHLML